MSELKIWYFTFGCGQKHAGHAQPIQASSYEIARATMFQLHSNKWCLDYSEETWNEMKADPNRRYPMEVELPTVIAVEVQIDNTTET